MQLDNVTASKLDTKEEEYIGMCVYGGGGGGGGVAGVGTLRFDL